ncbi:ATP-dependent RNA helicase dhx29 [Entophlyctis sp. JEL0112]|nr:ATP-dependent RNA helicase dhx29 [Entophlyctis sp. JEL0112]
MFSVELAMTTGNNDNVLSELAQNTFSLAAQAIECEYKDAVGSDLQLVQSVNDTLRDKYSQMTETLVEANAGAGEDTKSSGTDTLHILAQAVNELDAGVDEMWRIAHELEEYTRRLEESVALRTGGGSKTKASAGAARGFATTSVAFAAAKTKADPKDDNDEIPTPPQNLGLEPTGEFDPLPNAESPSTDEKQESATLARCIALAESDLRSWKFGAFGTLPSFSVPAELERDVINYVSQNFDKIARLSLIRKAPLSFERVLSLYITLESLGFVPDHIEDAIKYVIQSQGPQLCVHLDPEVLPQGFANKVKGNDDINISLISVAPRDDIAHSNATAAGPNPEESLKLNYAKNIKSELDSDLKSRILKLNEIESESDDEASLPMNDETPPHERHARFKIRLEYVKSELETKLKPARIPPHRQLLELIRSLSASIRALEKTAGFNVRAAEVAYARLVGQTIHENDRDFRTFASEVDELLKDAESVAKYKPPALEPKARSQAAEDEDGVFGDMFTDEPVLEDSRSDKNGAHRQVLSFSIPKSWTGKTPKTILQEQCNASISLPKRQSKGGVRIKYDALSDSTSSLFRCRVKVSNFGSNDAEFQCPSGVFIQGGMQFAEEYVATIALHSLFSKKPLYRSLPPDFRDVWLEMEGQKRKEGEIQDRVSHERHIRFSLSVVKSVATDNIIAPTEKRPANDENQKLRAQSGNLTSHDKTSELLLEEFRNRKKTEKYVRLAETRSQLPVSSKRNDILQLINNNQVIVLSGETGSGKSTQVPQFILESALELKNGAKVNIICTQPRRISAISIAARVSEEMGDPAGFAKGAFVGYAVRLESKASASTRLSFQTTGVLLRRLETDPLLEGVSHVVVDEVSARDCIHSDLPLTKSDFQVHERSLDSDFLLLLLRRLLSFRTEIKLVLMSATADADKFARYFESSANPNCFCSVITIPGRAFEVKTLYLEDAVEDTGYSLDPGSEFALRDSALRYDENYVVDDADDSDENLPEFSTIKQRKKYSKRTLNTLRRMNRHRIDLDLVEILIRHIVNSATDDSGSDSILVFLPGMAEIRKLYDRLTLAEVRENKAGAGMHVLPLHSTISSADQAEVFKPAPPGRRKVVLSTNIAETGVTIPDVVYVIDTCRAREISFKEKQNMAKLADVLVSKANCKQRCGRAGRVKPGVCYRLVTESDFDAMSEYRPPEMLRLPLEEIILRALAFAKFGGDSVDVRQLLAEAIDPPPARNVDRSFLLLKQIQALNSNSALTALGRKLAQLPLEVRLGKMLLLGCVLTESDLLTNANAFAAWRSHVVASKSQNGWTAGRDFAADNGLNFANLLAIEETRHQLLQSLASIGVIANNEKSGPRPPRPLLAQVPGACSSNEKETALVLTALAFGAFPSIMHYSSNPSSEHTPSGSSKTAKAGLRLPNSGAPVSVPRNSSVALAKLHDGAWCAAFSLTKTGGGGGGGGGSLHSSSERIVARDLSVVFKVALLAVAPGRYAEVRPPHLCTTPLFKNPMQHQTRSIKADADRIVMKCRPRTAAAFAMLLTAVDTWIESVLSNCDAEMDAGWARQGFDLWTRLICEEAKAPEKFRL